MKINAFTRTKDLRKRSASSDPAQERSTIYFWKIFGKFWEIVGEEEGGSSHMAAEGGEKKSSLALAFGPTPRGLEVHSKRRP